MYPNVQFQAWLERIRWQWAGRGVRPSRQQEERMPRQVAGIEVVGAVHVACRVETDDRHSVRTFGQSPEACRRPGRCHALGPDWSSHLVTSPRPLAMTPASALIHHARPGQFSWNERSGSAPRAKPAGNRPLRGKGACREHWAQDCRKKSSHPFVLLVAIVVSRKAISQYLGWRGRRTAKSNATGSGPCFRATISGEFHPFSPKNGPDHGLCGAPVEFTTRFAFRASSGYDRSR